MATKLIGDKGGIQMLTKKFIVILSAVAVMLAGIYANPAASKTKSGAEVGAYVKTKDGESPTQAFQRYEKAVGAKLDTVRMFRAWDEKFPNPQSDWAKANGKSLFISVRAVRHNRRTLVPWRDIANARPGSSLHNDMVGLAKSMKSYGSPIRFAFNHEPEAKEADSYGTAEEFKAAWKKLRQVFRDQGASNVRFAWTMTAHAFEVSSSDPRAADRWYPGDADVDMLAADGYNWAGCRSEGSGRWEDPAEVFGGFVNWAGKHPGKPLIFAEVGSVPGGGDRAAWFDKLGSALQKPGFNRVDMVLYYNSPHPGGGNCDWSLNAGQPGAAAMGRLASGGGSAAPAPVPATDAPASSDSSMTPSSKTPKPKVSASDSAAEVEKAAKTKIDKVRSAAKTTDIELAQAAASGEENKTGLAINKIFNEEAEITNASSAALNRPRVFRWIDWLFRMLSRVIPIFNTLPQDLTAR